MRSFGITGLEWNELRLGLLDLGIRVFWRRSDREVAEI